MLMFLQLRSSATKKQEGAKVMRSPRLENREGTEEAVEALNGTKLAGRELKLSIVEEPSSVKVVIKSRRPRIGRRF